MSERDTLIVDHLPEVRKRAARIRSRLPESVDVEDLIQAGTVGLIEAADSFDPAGGVKFWTFAQHRVEGEIHDYLRRLDCVSRDQRQLMKRADEAERQLGNELGRIPGEYEIFERTGASDRQRSRLRGTKTASLTRSKARDDKRTSMDVADTRNPPDAEIKERDRSEAVIQAIKSLPARMQVVIILYYFGEVTLLQIGMQIGVNESRASQIKTAAIIKLSSRFAERGITDV